jgi:acetyltransferase-like isoleucine patch superfamily enzyme
MMAMEQHADKEQSRAGRWEEGAIPARVRVGEGSIIKGKGAFRRFASQEEPGLIIGCQSLLDEVQFAVGRSGKITIGDHCYLTCAMLMAELEIRIGNHVVIGWNTAIADSDFHPIDPALRLADAIACSPGGKGQPRPPVEKKAVVIEDHVWIGPSVTILKGVRIGAGAFIEPGAVITKDVAAGSRVGGNPAVVIGKV